MKFLKCLLIVIAIVAIIICCYAALVYAGILAGTGGTVFGYSALAVIKVAGVVAAAAAVAVPVVDKKMIPRAVHSISNGFSSAVSKIKQSAAHVRPHTSAIAHTSTNATRVFIWVAVLLLLAGGGFMIYNGVNNVNKGN